MRDLKRHLGLILISMATYVVRRKTLQKYLCHAEIEKLVAQGYLRQIVPDSAEPIMVVRAPELLASEMAAILTDRLLADAKTDVSAAAKALVSAGQCVPLGDIIGAQAILDAAYREGGLPMSLIMQLIELKPEQHPVKPGTQGLMYVPGIGAMEVSFERDGSVVLHAPGERITLQEADSRKTPMTISNMHS